MKARPVQRPGCRATGARPAPFEAADEQGEGGDGRQARNAGQDRESLGEVRISLNLLEDRRLDRRDLAFNLFEALRILALQRWRGKDLAAVRRFGLSPGPRERGEAH
jgi:hypothetical protein